MLPDQKSFMSQNLTISQKKSVKCVKCCCSLLILPPSGHLLNLTHFSHTFSDVNRLVPIFHLFRTEDTLSQHGDTRLALHLYFLFEGTTTNSTSETFSALERYCVGVYPPCHMQYLLLRQPPDKVSLANQLAN